MSHSFAANEGPDRPAADHGDEVASRTGAGRPRSRRGAMSGAPGEDGPGRRSDARTGRAPPAPLSAAVTVVAAALALAGCGGDGSGQGSGADAGGAAEAGSPVETAVARSDSLSSTVRAVGTLGADARVEVRPEVEGHVTSIEFEEGAEVREGQVLVRLDQNQLEAELRAARAAASRTRTTAANLERRLARNDSLLAAGAISQQAYDDLEAEWESAESSLQEAEANAELAEQRLEDATVRAPFDGRAGARDFHRGDYVQMGQVMFTVVDDDPLEVQFSVPERHLGRLTVGSPVRVTVRSQAENPATGRVSFVSPYVEPSSRSVQLKARIPNPASELRPGQFANVTLELDRREGVVVPEAAVVPGQDQNRVFVVRGGAARERAVQLGQRSRGSVEVLSGVAAGDTVVVAGQQRISDGAAVSAAAGAPPPDESGSAAGAAGADGGSGGGADAGPGAGDGSGADAGAGSGAGSETGSAGRGEG